MYTYTLDKVSEVNMNVYTGLYMTNFPQSVVEVIFTGSCPKGDLSTMAEVMQQHVDDGSCSYFISAKVDDAVIGCMGIREVKPNFYQFLHLVVHEGHRNKGVATSIIQQSVPLLQGVGATIIRNHKRENYIPHTVFTDLGFVLVEYNDEEEIFKWTYQLNL